MHTFTLIKNTKVAKSLLFVRLFKAANNLTSWPSGQVDQLSRYHIQTLRNIQSLPQRTAWAAVYMLLGALPLEAELHKRRLSLLNSVITSDNECLKGLVQRQLACSFNVKSSFFNITSKILENMNTHP